jgi:hypothetical protein
MEIRKASVCTTKNHPRFRSFTPPLRKNAAIRPRLEHLTLSKRAQSVTICVSCCVRLKNARQNDHAERLLKLRQHGESRMAEPRDEGLFYVELRSEDGAHVEMSARRQDFDLAIAWLGQRLAHAPTKLGRMQIPGSHQITYTQHGRLVRFGVKLF